MTHLPLFRHVEFLAPGRRIRTLLDSSAGLFARVPAGRVSIAVEYERPDGKRRVTKVAHDLEVFRELAYVV